MSDRVKMLNRIDSSETCSFLLCNLLGRRTRQLATRESSSVLPNLVNAALLEFLEGKLLCEFNGGSTHSAGFPNSPRGATDESDSHDRARRGTSRRKLEPPLESAVPGSAVPVKG